MMVKSLIGALASLWIFGSGSFFANAQEEPFTVPRSNRVITGEMRLPDGSVTRFVARDGTWVTVEDKKSGYYFGFAGIINDQTSNPNFLAYNIVRDTRGGTHAKEATSPLDVPIGKSITYRSAKGKFELRVKMVSEWQFASAPISDPSQFSPAELQELFGLETSDSLCCLTCDQRTVCATSVENKCGSCGSGGGGALAY